MFNVFKGQKVSEDEKRVIDSNDRVFELIEIYNEKLKEDKQKRREAALMELLDWLEPDEEGNYFLPRDEEGNFEIPLDEDGVPLVDVDENGMLIPSDDSEEEPAEEDMQDEFNDGEEEGEVEEVDEGPDPHEQAEFIIGNARLEAEEILAEAQNQAAAYRENAKEEGRQEGYTMGQAQAMSELDEQRNALAQEGQRLQAEYENRLASMEVELVDMISDIVEKVFLAEFSDKRDITLHLIENTIAGVKSSREFLIRVNEANYNFLSEHKDELQEKVGEGAKLDLVMDPLMEDAKCLIETDGGVFDCGMDTQMRNLVNDIKALSMR